MESRNDKKRMNVEGDRLSSLPDDIIHKILSFISLQEAIGTSALSSRWRYIWTSMPYLKFSTQRFAKFSMFSRFATHVLSRLNNQVQVSSLELTFHGRDTQTFVKRIIDHALSHSVQQLSVVSCPNKGKIEIPLSLFSSQSLKHLILTQSPYYTCFTCTLASTWDLPALTTLYLSSMKLNGENTDLFSNCPNLKNLTLSECIMKDPDRVKICHSNLSSFTLEYMNVDTVNLEAPQLKDLIFYRNNIENVSVKAASLEKVDLCLEHQDNDHVIVDLLQQFRSVKFLTLNLEIVELLSSSIELISNQPSPFADLKSLKIYPINEDGNRYVDKKALEKVDMSAIVKNYFLDSSPSATLTMVLREEIKAHKLMEKLQMMLKQWKANCDKNAARMDQGKVENQRAQQETSMQWHFGERLTQIQSYWRDLNKWYQKGDKMTSCIISTLRKIENLLQKLPTSQRAKMQPAFSSLCAESDTLMDNMIDRVKIQCDKKPRHSNVYFHELATTSQPPS